MKVSQKVFKIVSLPFFFSIVVVFIFSRTSILKSFNDIETRKVKEDTQRVINFIYKEVNNLSLVNYDYSNWTETYDFMESHDEQYIKVNYADFSSLKKYRINCIMFVDNSGNIVYSHTIEGNKGLNKSFNDYEKQEIARKTKEAFQNNVREVKGIMNINNKMLLLAARPIVKSDGTGAPRGFIVFGSIIDEELVNYFSMELKFNLSIERYNDLNKESEQLKNRDVLIHIKDDNIIEGYSIMSDLFQYPAIVVHLTTDRTIYKQAEGNIRFFTIILVVVWVAFNSIVIILLDKMVVKKIVKIKSAIDKVNETGDLTQQIEISGNDEITHLAQDFNTMFHILNESKKHSLKLAYYDPLTGLPNRKKLIERLEQKIRDDSEKFAVLFIDLDNFKYINDSLGHDVGDIILERVAGRLKKYETSGNLISRVGGDEFVVIQESVGSAADAEKLAVSISNTLRPVIKYNNREHYIGASVGISLFPEHGQDVSTLMKNADAAMYAAKKNGKHGYRIYSDDINMKTLEDLTLENHLRKALKKNDLLIHFQPILSIDGKCVIACEALTRWVFKGKMIFPGEFIPMAKKIGEIVHIDNWVLHNACVQCKKWHDEGNRSLYVSINLSFKQLVDGNIVEEVKKALNTAELEPQYLSLEITEDESMEDVGLTISILKKLKELGVKISLDDFGIGYSSLSYVNMLPLDVIKVDRSLIENIHTDNKNLEIIRSIIAMAHSLNTTVVAEGIENEEQLNKLQELGCDAAQGFYLGKPTAAELFRERFLGNK